MDEKLNRAEWTLDRCWRVETDEGTRWYSTLRDLEAELGPQVVLDMPGGLRVAVDTWRQLDIQSRRIDRERRATLDSCVRELVERQGWARADVAYFLGKTATVINRSLLRSAKEEDES